LSQSPIVCPAVMKSSRSPRSSRAPDRHPLQVHGHPTNRLKHG
jgi:hypothetical protein